MSRCPAWRVVLGSLLLLVGIVVAQPPGLYSLSVVVFYDENRNGIEDPGENGRIPGVLVEVGGQSGRSEEGTGRVILTGIPAGRYPVSIRTESLPPFYVAGPSPSVPIPGSGVVYRGVTLPIGSNRPNTYMAFGDSITDGEGSSNRQGYRKTLEAKLQRHFGHGFVINEGVAGATSDRGVRRIVSALSRHHPAYTLVLLGTNDWDENRSVADEPYASVESLRKITRRIKAVQSLAFMATVPSTNVGFDARATRERNRWILSLNELLRSMALEEGAILVDLEKAFLEQGDPGRLFTDHLHPNDHGYQVIADAFFDAITRPTTRGADPAPSSEHDDLK